jgi:putative FmdB family regulatory protein
VPIYEYQCDACQHKFETIQKVSDPLLEECPECGEKSLRKLVSAAAFRLKGTGWYVTDFKDKPAEKSAGQSKPGADNKESASSEKKESASSSSSEGKSADSKTEAKTDKKPASGSD